MAALVLRLLFLHWMFYISVNKKKFIVLIDDLQPTYDVAAVQGVVFFNALVITFNSANVLELFDFYQKCT